MSTRQAIVALLAFLLLLAGIYCAGMLLLASLEPGGATVEARAR